MALDASLEHRWLLEHRPVIALDGVSEKGIEVVVRGGIKAVYDHAVDVVFVGNHELGAVVAAESGRSKHDRHRYHKQIDEMGNPNKPAGYCYHEAEVVVGMDAGVESARDKDSSIVRAARLVGDGKADALVSAGNSGVTGAAALFYMKRIQGLKRPLIVCKMPTYDGREVLLGDVGFNFGDSAYGRCQNAILMSGYAEIAKNIPEPRIAQLNIGTEASKGRQVEKETHGLLEKLCSEGVINYMGNMEPGNITQGDADCFVCGGQEGNLILKAVEAYGKFLKEHGKRWLKSSPINVLLAVPALPFLAKFAMDVGRKMNKSEYGGALMLGLDKTVVITHGNSDAKAIQASVRVARDYSLIIPELKDSYRDALEKAEPIIKA